MNSAQRAPGDPRGAAAQRRRHGRARSLLALLACLVFGLLLHSWHGQYQRITAQHRAQLLSQSRVIDDLVTHQLRSLHETLARVAIMRLPANEQEVAAQAEQLAILVQAVGAVRAISVVDRDGVIRASNRAEEVGVNVADAPAFRAALQAREAGRMFVPPPVRNPTGPGVLQVAVARLRTNGAKDGAVLAVPDPDFFTRIMLTANYETDMQSEIAHDGGDSFVMVPGGVAPVLRAGAGGIEARDGAVEGVFQYIVPGGGSERLIALSTVTPEAAGMDHALIIAASRATRDIYAEWRYAVALQAALVLAGSLLAGAGLYLYQRRQTVFAGMAAQAALSLRAEQDLKQRYLDVVEAVIVAVNMAGRLTLANRKACEVLGAGAHELRGRPWFEHFLPYGADDERGTLLFDTVSSGAREGPLNFEHELLAAGGVVRLYSWHASALVDAAGEMSGILLAGEDITERQRTTEELYRHRHHLQELIDASTQELLQRNADVAALLAEQKAILDNQEAGIVKLKKGAFIWTNPGFDAALGYATGALVGQSTRVLFGDDLAWQKFDTICRDVGCGTGSFHGDVEVLCSDGTQRWLDAHIAVLPGGGGELIASLTDVTERPAQTQELQRLYGRIADREKFLRTLTDNLPVSISYWDGAERLRFANRAVGESAGLAPEQLPGMALADLLGPDAYARAAGYIRAVLA
ncbi:MAG: PAS domain S-box protein, partial [Rhodocyclaceae bacterium]|nr:PAS domain S-box protein [Rhodocyclaceae bacterium]